MLSLFVLIRREVPGRAVGSVWLLVKSTPFAVSVTICAFSTCCSRGITDTSDDQIGICAANAVMDVLLETTVFLKH